METGLFDVLTLINFLTKPFWKFSSPQNPESFAQCFVLMKTPRGCRIDFVVHRHRSAWQQELRPIGMTVRDDRANQLPN